MRKFFDNHRQIYSMIVVVVAFALFHRRERHQDRRFRPIRHHHFAIEDFYCLDSKQVKRNIKIRIDVFLH